MTERLMDFLAWGIITIGLFVLINMGLTAMSSDFYNYRIDSGCNMEDPTHTMRYHGTNVMYYDTDLCRWYFYRNGDKIIVRSLIK